MPFQRYVETGRVAYIADGPLKGHLCAIVDVINQTKVLVDGPTTGVPRQALRLNQLHLTKFRIKFPFVARSRVVKKAWTDGKVSEKWAESMWARKLANKAKRAEMNDFDRYKLRTARRERNKLRTGAFKFIKRQKAKALKAKLIAKKAGGAKAPPKKEKAPAAKKEKAPAKKEKAPAEKKK